jgi:predicted unusual protein kinase regulating ubiquinone biosynthesis (AarF/ABC1/UbiB family)
MSPTQAFVLFLGRRKIYNHEGLQRKYAIQLREAFTKLGPSFVKLGQVLI